MVAKSLSVDLKPENVETVLLHPGWVRTRMTKNNGLIDVEESAGGLISVLEELELNGKWYDYKKEEIKW